MKYIEALINTYQIQADSIQIEISFLDRLRMRTKLMLAMEVLDLAKMMPRMVSNPWIPMILSQLLLLLLVT